MKCVGYRDHMRRYAVAAWILLVGAIGGPATGHAEEFLFATTTDFITGSSSRVGMGSPPSVDLNVQSVHSDAVCRYDDGRVYVVNRFGGDNIQILDPSAGFATLAQFSVGGGSDPHDIVILSPSKAYVTRYNETTLAIVNPQTQSVTGTIDLSAWADADGLPEMDQMVRVGRYVYVTIQRLDRNAFFTPTGASYVAVIDSETDQVVDVDAGTPGVQAIELAGTNPFSEIKLDPFSGRLYVSCAGFFGVQDDGVEWIDPLTYGSSGVFFDEVAAGGDVNDVHVVGGDRGFAIVADLSFNTLLVAFDPQSGVLTDTLYAPGGYVLNDIEVSPDQRLFLADRTPTAPGLRIFDSLTNAQLTGAPVDVGLPPFDLCFSTPVQTAVDAPTPPPAALHPLYPNPFAATTAIPMEMNAPGRLRLAVYDVSGRLVKRLVDRVGGVGPHVVRWDGRDGRGRRVASGIYFVRLDTAGQRFTQRAAIVR